MNWKLYTHYYLVGIKGVAMTSLAQILLDAGKTVRGSDSSEDFVTKEILDRLALPIDSFEAQPPTETECVIYTAAHKGQFNPQVLAAQERGIACFSQAEALAAFFNEKKGVAVCGVGGKSTTSAMITWILEKTGHQPSFSVGVGKILGMDRTGQWRSESEYFVAEADEYVTDPTAPSRGEEITPRFSYLHPFVTVCTNIRFDHPDVYTNLEHTTSVFQKFFTQIQPNGFLVANYADKASIEAAALQQKVVYIGSTDLPEYYFGLHTDAASQQLQPFLIDKTDHDREYLFELTIPGFHNLENAAFAIVTCKLLGVPIEKSAEALRSFQSTQRRFENRGLKNGVQYFDDYAHHPDEVRVVIEALNTWYPTKRSIIAFQSHTFSRTKQLFAEFVDAFKEAKEVVLIDIFASAREAYDPSITSDMLVAAIQQKYPTIKIQNLKTISSLATYLQRELHPGDICLTIGAGDIYKVHDILLG